jgi:hypothetical protein
MNLLTTEVNEHLVLMRTVLLSIKIGEVDTDLGSNVAEHDAGHLVAVGVIGSIFCKIHYTKRSADNLGGRGTVYSFMVAETLLMSSWQVYSFSHLTPLTAIPSQAA